MLRLVFDTAALLFQTVSEEQICPEQDCVAYSNTESRLLGALLATTLAAQAEDNWAAHRGLGSFLGLDPNARGACCVASQACYHRVTRSSMHWNKNIILLVSFFAIFTRTLPAVDAPVTSSEPLRKAVSRYALTSANDFQQRDPQDWRLLASNDGGKTWITLDTRRGQVFEDRHQRRVFVLENTNAFSTYRLQIDRVREPKAANSVQLAEVELMGQGTDDFGPTPIFCDQITAQGDNPPLETVADLFDGRIETKWLDRPQERSTCASWIQWQYSPPSETLITNIAQLFGLRVRAEAGYRVRLEGVIVGRGASPATFMMLDDTGILELKRRPELGQCLPGQRILVEGASDWVGEAPQVGQSSMKLIEPLASATPAAISPEQDLAPGTDLQWVEVDGVVQFQQQTGDQISFELCEGENCMSVRLATSEGSGTMPVDGQRVRVSGICRGGFNEKGVWVAAKLWAASPASVKPAPDDAKPSEAIQSTSSAGERDSGITKIVQIRKLDNDPTAPRQFVKIRGVITGLLGAYVQDDTAGIQVAFRPEDNRRIKQLGEYVEVEGWTGLTDAFTPVISADRVVLLGRGKLPKPQQPPLGQLASGWMDSQWVELDGVVRATDGAHLLLNCDGRQVTASLSAASTRVVKELVDASVRVRGVGVAALDDWGRKQGVHLLIPSLEFLQIERAAPEPFSQPVQPIRTVLRVSGPGEASHRVRVAGVLTLQDDQRLFLQDPSGSAMAIFKQEVVLDSAFGRSQWSFWRTPAKPVASSVTPKFAPGDRVEVIGFQDAHGYSTVLTEAVARKVSSGGEVVAQEIDASSFSNWKLDSHLVKLEGVLIGEQVLGDRLVLEMLCHGRTLQAFMPTGVDLEENFQLGTTLQVTGVWQMDPVYYAELGRSVGAVRIMVRSPSDFLVLERPPWWTLQRALMVIGGLGVVLLLALVWITQLHRKVEQRSVQLSAEIHRREQMEHQRALEEERSRIARDLHDDLGAALTQIRFLSAVESRDNAVPEGTRSRLRQVTEKSHQLVSSLDEIVWAINPANDSLPNLVNYLCHAAAELFAPTPIRCRLDVDDVLPAVPLTSEVRHHLYLAVLEALNNIAKHSEATEVWLRFRAANGLLEIVIEDNGRGFSDAMETSGGHGLRNMRQRMEQIGGQFHCASKAGVGTVFGMTLPLRAVWPGATITPA